MHRIDARTVELTAIEIDLNERFHSHLDHGSNIVAATVAVFREADLDEPLDAAFLEYLSDGTVTIDGHGRIQRGPNWERVVDGRNPVITFGVAL